MDLGAHGEEDASHGERAICAICAIDRAVLPTLMDFWVPGVQVAGIHELVGNALVMPGEKERTTNLRGMPLPGREE